MGRAKSRHVADVAGTNINHLAATYTAAVFLYLTVNLFGRWLRWSTFHAHGVYGVAEPTSIETALAVLANTVPVLICVYLIHSIMTSTRFSLVFAAITTFFVLLGIEMDLEWYAISGVHARWHDITVLVIEDWHDHLGLRSSDIIRFAKIGAAHLVSVVLIALCVSLAPIHWTHLVARKWIDTRVALLTLLLAFAVTKGSVVHGHAVGNEYWSRLAHHNPFYPEFGDDYLIGRLRDPQGHLLAINRAINASSPAQLRSSFTLPAMPARRPNIVFLVVEGWNANFFDTKTTPYLYDFATRHCFVSSNHYSTGNMTEYGVMGLLGGDPVTFFRKYDAELPGRFRYLAALRHWGYRTARLGGGFDRHHQNLERYLTVFSDRPKAAMDDWSSLTQATAILREQSPVFLYYHYWSTHFPYEHGSDYTKFLPATPSVFEYSEREQIVNRYRNALVEFDNWARAFLSEIDLEHTILVVTGDHGEEMFDNGPRFGHASALTDPQIRTPFLLCAPTIRDFRAERRPTSHADVMPTIMDLIGGPNLSLYSGSIFQPAEDAVAVIAMNNHTKPAKIWRLVTSGMSAEFQGSIEEEVRFKRLLTHDSRAWATRLTRDEEESLIRQGTLLRSLLAVR